MKKILIIFIMLTSIYISADDIDTIAEVQKEKTLNIDTEKNEVVEPINNNDVVKEMKEIINIDNNTVKTTLKKDKESRIIKDGEVKIKKIISKDEDTKPKKDIIDEVGSVNEVETKNIDINVVKEKIVKCYGCHGKDFSESAFGKTPSLKEIDVMIIIERLQQYKKGNLDQYGNGELMTGQMKDISKNEISILSQYIKSISKK